MTQVACGYCRLSQDSDTSIDRQKRKIREYCEETGLELDRILDDGERSSGFNPEREQYQVLKEAVREGTIDVVVVNDRTRIGRDFDERMEFIFLLRASGVELHTAREGAIDLSDPTRVVFESFHAAKDHQSAQEEIEKAREAIQERIEAGKYHGRPRYGTTLDDSKSHLVPGEDFDDALLAIAMREVLDDDGEHLYSYRDILDATGVPSTSTLKSIIDRKEWYRALAREHGYELPDVPTEVTVGSAE